MQIKFIQNFINIFKEKNINYLKIVFKTINIIVNFSILYFFYLFPKNYDYIFK